MNIEDKAYKLYKSGSSYGEIADELSISKSTAHNYVKKMKKLNEEVISPLFQHSFTNDLNVRSNQNKNERRTNESLSINKIKMSDVKEFTGDELLKKEFITLEFMGKFLELIGKPSKPFSGIIWGLPKSGKSNFAIRFADYLNEYFGRTSFIASEEGESATLQLKIRDISGSDMTIAAISDRQTIKKYLESQKFEFVFIDSLNYAQIDHLYLEELKQGSPNTSFIGILQATKGGNFKGDQAFTHNCDFIIKVENGIAYQQGRFNADSEIEIFKKPLYKKNPNKKTEVTLEIKTEDIDNIPPIEVSVNIKTNPIELEDVPNTEITPVKKEQISKNAQSAIEVVQQQVFNPKTFLTLLALSAGVEIIGGIIRHFKTDKIDEKDSKSEN